MKDDKPSVIVMPDGPYILNNISSIKVVPSGDTIALQKGKILLCGCGSSKTLPRCDGTHAKFHFQSENSPETVPPADKDYWGKAITVHFDLAVCAHVAVCVNQLPKVFDTKKRPWINPDQGKVEDIVNTVRACPSGALSYTLKDQPRVDSFHSVNEVIYNENGPYELWGGIEIQGAKQPKVADHYTLCSCGESKNHPYCDGNHRRKKDASKDDAC